MAESDKLPPTVEALGIRANGNIVFLVAYTIKYPKMYSFDTLHKNPAKLHYEPD